MVGLRRFALLWAAGAGSTWCDAEEECSALLQTTGRGGLRSLVLRRANQALDKLLVSATDMLRNGASPEILAFTDDTLNAIKAEVLPIIEGAPSELAQMLEQQLESSRRFGESYQRQLDTIALYHREEVNSSLHHQACRLAEQGRCAKEQECERELTERWEQVEDLEEELELISDDISSRWCPAGVNTSEDAFRGASVDQFDKYAKKRELVREAWKAYNDYLPNCQEPPATEPPQEASWGEDAWGEESWGEAPEAWDKKSECDMLQMELEAISCMRGHYAGKAKATMRDSWALIAQAFNATAMSVAAAVEARKHEWTTLKTVECLLKKIHDLGGMPCERAADARVGDADRQVQSCHNLASNTSHLDVQIPALDTVPQVPERLPQPCEDDWVEQEYTPFEPCVAFAPCQMCATSWDEW